MDDLPEALRDLAHRRRGVVTAAEASRIGVTRSELRAALDAERLVGLVRGVYVLAEAWEKADEDRRYALRCLGVGARLTSPGIGLSHESAAVLWGAPRLVRRPTVHVSGTGLGATTTSDGVRRHNLAMPNTERTERHGVTVTSRERTLVDCAGALREREAIVVVEGLLHRWRKDPADAAIIEAILARGRTGAPAARRLLSWAGELSESPGESLTRYDLRRTALPEPRQQVEIATRRGLFRVDFLWDAWRVVLEFDGRKKFGPELTDDPAHVAFANERRKTAIEELGYVVIHMYWDDLGRPTWLERHVHAAATRAMRR